MNKEKLIDIGKLLIGAKRVIFQISGILVVSILSYCLLDYITIGTYTVKGIEFNFVETFNYDTIRFLLSLGVLISLWYVIYKHNADAEIQIITGETYGCYPYWYFKLSTFLGIKKCSLIGMPIYMQYKLILRGTFKNIVPTEIEEVTGLGVNNPVVLNEDIVTNHINIVINDSYTINQSQLPLFVKEEYTVIFSRMKYASIRVFDMDFMNQIHNFISDLPANISTINLFMTTNPRHNEWMAKNIFYSAGRGDIKRLFIYDQEKCGSRSFVDCYRVK